jgi:beta-lactamase regulating signal transducer with metallopeptidase domain
MVRFFLRCVGVCILADFVALAWWSLQLIPLGGLLGWLLAAKLLLLCSAAEFSPPAKHMLLLVVLLKVSIPIHLLWAWQVPVFWERPPDQSLSRPALERPYASDTEAPAERDEGQVSAVFTKPASSSEQEPGVLDGTSVVRGGETKVGHVNPGPPKELAVPSVPVSLGRRALPLSFDSPPWYIRFGWLGGTVAMLIGLVWELSSDRRLLARSRPAPPEVAALVEALAKRLRTPFPTVLVMPGRHSPFVWGLIYPRLVLPEDLVGKLNCRSIRQVIVHELAHLARRDLWAQWAVRLATCLYWWNPLVWLIAAALSEAAEESCDGWVVAEEPEGGREEYAETLGSVLEFVAQGEAVPVAALGLGTSKSWFRKRKLAALKRRVEMILGGRFAFRLNGGWLVAIFALALAALPGWAIAPEEVEVGERFYIYHNDDKSNIFIPSGWMNERSDGTGISLNTAERDTPQSKPTCTRVTCRLSEYEWVGIYYLLDGSWKPDRPIDLFAKLVAKKGDRIKCRFWARSRDRACVQFKVGGVTKGKVSDSLRTPVETDWITLTPDWKLHDIDLKHADVSSLVGGFAWVCDRAHNHAKDVSFDLDTAYFVKTLPRKD